MSSEFGTEAPAAGCQRTSWFDRFSLGFVLLVWLECLIATQTFIASYASRAPYADDMAPYYVRGMHAPLFDYLWGLHNEHRLPVPKILQWVLLDWSGDVRTSMYVEAQIYGLIALACIFAARRLRGSSRPWDAFFPLIWLQLGNSENLLMGFQLCIAIPGACVCTALFLSAFSPRRLWPSRAIPSGIALVILPLCGGGGLLQVPMLGAWLAWLGFTNRKHPDRRERRGAWIYLFFVFVTVALCAAYLVGFERPTLPPPSGRENPVWKLALANISAPFGPDFERWLPAAQTSIAIAVAVLAFLLVRRGARARDPRALGSAAVVLGGLLLAIAIARGRPIEGPVLVANRYIALPTPLYVALALGALAVFDRRWREITLVVCCVIMAISTPGSIRRGLDDGVTRRAHEQELDRLVATRAGWTKVQAYYAEHFMLGQVPVAHWLLEFYLHEHLPPFDRGGLYVMAPSAYPAFLTVPVDVHFEFPPLNRVVDNEALTYARPPTTFDFPVAKENHSFQCEIGVPDSLLESQKHPGVRARVVLRVRDSGERDLGTIALDPVHVPAERGLIPFEFHWESGHEGIVSLIFESAQPPNGPRRRDWVGVRRANVE